MRYMTPCIIWLTHRGHDVGLMIAITDLHDIGLMIGITYLHDLRVHDSYHLVSWPIWLGMSWLIWLRFDGSYHVATTWLGYHDSSDSTYQLYDLGLMTHIIYQLHSGTLAACTHVCHLTHWHVTWLIDMSLDSLSRGITYLWWPCGMTSVKVLTQRKHIRNMRSHVWRDSLTHGLTSHVWRDSWTHGLTYVWWPWGMTSVDVLTELRHTSSMRSHPLPIPKLPSACEPCCTRTNETCHTYEYGMSYMWMSHVTQINVALVQYAVIPMWSDMSHVTQINVALVQYAVIPMW